MLHLMPAEVEDSRRPAPGPGARGLGGAVYDASPFISGEVRLMDMSRRGFVCAVAFGLALVLGASGRADAQSTLEIVKKRGKVIAGVKTDFPPFGTIDAAGKNVGFDVDVAHRFAKALFNDENQVELVAVTSGNRIPFLQSGKIDIIIATVTITDERRQVVEFSEPYFLSGSLLLVPRASTARGLEDMAGRSVVLGTGGHHDYSVAA